MVAIQVVYRVSLAHRHALAAEEVVFGDGGGPESLFFGRGVVYMVGGGDAEGVGVFGVAFIDMRAARARVGDEVLGIYGNTHFDLGLERIPPKLCPLRSDNKIP